MKTLIERLGALLRQRREELNRTPAQLGAKARVGKKAVESWEKAQSMPPLKRFVSKVLPAYRFHRIHDIIGYAISAASAEETLHHVKLAPPSRVGAKQLGILYNEYKETETLPDSIMDVCWLDLGPGAETQHKGQRHADNPGQEIIVVISGEIRLHFEENGKTTETVDAKTHEIIMFRSHLRHWAENVGSSGARILVFHYPPRGTP